MARHLARTRECCVRMCLEARTPYTLAKSGVRIGVCIPCCHAFPQVGARMAATSLKTRSDGGEEAMRRACWPLQVDRSHCRAPHALNPLRSRDPICGVPTPTAHRPRGWPVPTRGLTARSRGVISCYHKPLYHYHKAVGFNTTSTSSSRN